MAFSSFAFSNLSFLLDCGVDFLWCYLQGSVDCKCQVTSLWVEFINTVSLFAPVDLAGGWGKEEQLKICSVPTKLKEITLITEMSTIKAHDPAWICPGLG